MLCFIYKLLGPGFLNWVKVLLLSLNIFIVIPIKRWSRKMIKHAQTILWLLPTNCLSAFDHFVVLAFGITYIYWGFSEKEGRLNSLAQDRVEIIYQWIKRKESNSKNSRQLTQMERWYVMKFEPDHFPFVSFRLRLILTKCIVIFLKEVYFFKTAIVKLACVWFSDS